MLSSLLFAFFFTGIIQACEIGNEYSSEDEVSDIEGKWFLNVAIPANCSGSINKYRFWLYEDNLNDETVYDITLAIWKPINSTTYEIDSSTIEEDSFEYDDKRRKKRGLRSRSEKIRPAVGVRKGSVIGVYLDNSNPQPIVGEREGGSDINGNPIGVCVTTASATTSILNCTESNHENEYLIHVEADINIVNCGTPTAINNGEYNLTDGDTQYGARAQYTCNTGYNATGTDTISCQLNGQWRTTNFSCTIVNCGNPGVPVNGYTNGSVFVYQSIVQYYCNEGYQLSGDSSAQCTAAGDWNVTLPNCTLINCEDPGIPDNGTRNGDNFYYNSNVTYNCNNGYNLTGTATLTCLSSGTWNDTAPTCPLVICDDPGTPPNGSRSGDIFTYNSVVLFQCSSGYSLSGSATLTCLSNGSWNTSVPSCVAGCSDPGVPTNGQRSGEMFSHNSVVSYRCNTGYILIGANSLTCLQNNSWNNARPSCTPVNCNDPGKPTNGTKYGTNFTYTSTITYSCNVGYNLLGASSLTCLSNASWNGSKPSCVIVSCGNPGTLSNGTLTEGASFSYGSTLSYSCNTGYNLTGADTLNCLSNGSWDAPVPSCLPVNCGNPGTLKNGERNGDTFTYNSSISYQCDSGYSLFGSVILTCLPNGSWNASVPLCYPNCNDPGTLTNGQRVGNSFIYNAVVLYSCNNGYNLTGESTLTCQSDGSWSNTIPSCNPVNCGDPGTISNGDRTGNVFTYQAQIIYSCDDDFSLVGSPIITCQSNGSWSDTVPVCTHIDCTDPGIPANGVRIGNDFSYNSSVSFSCYPGYQLNGSGVITCDTESKWSSTNLPSCDVIYCSAPVVPDNGNVSYTSLSVNSSVYFTCNTGYTPIGNTNITCLPNGQWSNASVPSCDITVCPPLTPPSHGYLTPLNQYTYGTVVTFSCQTGYGLVPVGVSMLTCTGTGQWSNNIIPSCIAIVNPSSSGTSSRLSTTSTTYTMTGSTQRSSSTGTASITQRSSSSTGTTSITHSITASSSTASITPTPSAGDTNSLPLTAIGAAVGAVLLVIILFIIALLLIILLVRKSKQKSGKMDIPAPKNKTSVTNPILFSDIYNSMSQGTDTMASNYEVPVTTLRKEIPIADYEDPVQTLKHDASLNAGSAYAQLEDLDLEEESKYPIEDMYNAEDIADIKLPPPLFLEDDDDDDGVANSLYFINEEDEDVENEKEKEAFGARPLYHTLERSEMDQELPQKCSATLKHGKINRTEQSTKRSATLSHGKVSAVKKSEAGQKRGENPTRHSATLTHEKSGEAMKNKPAYFTLEGDRSKPPPEAAYPLHARRNTSAFCLPGDNESEIYGQIKKTSTPMLSRNSLMLSTKIGSGQFGNVCRGQWKKPNGDTIDVAVKMLQDGASEQEKIKFLQEAAIMSQFNHSNVIKLHGVVHDKKSPMIVIEYMPKGDLFGVLQKMRPDPGELVHHDTPELLLSFCQQVCLGMTYLSSKGFVHRDLAARNILVSADNVCKIIDFGLSRDLEDENYYVSRKGAMIPVKWTAPEALNYRKYSTASDVWSYGCLMYEIWSIGCKPYEKDSNISALEKICSSKRLPPPPGCPEAIYSLMISCWHPVAVERPSFHDVMVSLLQPNQTILKIPKSALASHPQAGTLGGSLKAGEKMYPELKNIYSDVMVTMI